MKKKVCLILMLLALGLSARAQETFLYATRDTCDLFMDVYYPPEDASDSLEGRQKPAILFVFGGGFVTGQRSANFERPWFEKLTAAGYPVISIDYRLGMKGYQMGKGLIGAYKASKQFLIAQQMGVEDVFSAIKFLQENKEAIGIDPFNIVLAGSSAGAIISMAAAYDVAAQAPGTAVLPEGFAFKGVMSFAGAIISIKGAPVFPRQPCPIAMFHGSADKAVAYKHYGTVLRGLWGSSFYASQFAKKGYPYTFYSFTGRSHDVAAYMHVMWDKEIDFLEHDVILGEGRTIEAEINDPSLPTWGNISLNDIYKK
jgi:dienelactone hydrolase